MDTQQELINIINQLALDIIKICTEEPAYLDIAEIVAKKASSLYDLSRILRNENVTAIIEKDI